MFAVARFKVTLGEAAVFESNLSQAMSALAACPGYLKGEYGQNLDDSTLWSLITQWENVGSYRRALSNNTVKMQAIPVLAQAIDEPGAYEHLFRE
jgi:quinol monooxygenase YgiN